MAIRHAFLLFLLVLLPAAAAGQTPPGFVWPTLSDWGGAGLLDSPSARMLPVGTVTAGVTSQRRGTRHITFGVQPLPWLEMVARATLAPSVYGLNEPGLDLKLRLWDEGEWWPALAVGARDISGIGYDLPERGRMAAEYLVASRRWWDLDVTVGLGWGRLGEGTGFANPLPGRFNDARRLHGIGSRGPRAWFTGRRTGLFGGVEWRTPVEGFTLKLDLPGRRFAYERSVDPTFPTGRPWSVALTWKPAPWADVSLGWEQGASMLRLSLTPGPEDLIPSRTPRRPPPLSWPVERPADAMDADTLATAAGTEGLPARAAFLDGEQAILWLDPAGQDGPAARQVGRAARLLAEAAAPTAESLTVVTGAGGLDGAAITLPRAQIERAMARRGSPEEIWRTTDITDAPPVPPPAWSWRVMPVLALTSDQSLFEEGTSYAGRTVTDAGLTVEPFRGIILDATARITAGSTLGYLDVNTLPVERPVRSDVALYDAVPVRAGRLQLSWLSSPVPQWHTRLSAGWMDEMYAGGGAEILWKPVAARWAFGLDLNRVWKREAAAGLAVQRGSSRVTGHLAGYLDSADGMSTASLRLGRYLGRDWGATLDLSHRFANGVSVGAYATWTDGARTGGNALARLYGLSEGRIDHGLRLTVPLGAVGLARAETGVDGHATVTTRSLGRDSGQRLEQPHSLHDHLSPAGFGPVAGSWARLMD